MFHFIVTQLTFSLQCVFKFLPAAYEFNRVGILAFHLALVSEPCDPLTVATFALAIQNGGDLVEAISIARGITRPYDSSFSELVEPQALDNDSELMDEVLELASSVKAAMSMMTDEHFVSQAMAKYSQAAHSDLVLSFPAPFPRRLSKSEFQKKSHILEKFRSKTLNHNSYSEVMHSTIS